MLNTFSDTFAAEQLTTVATGQNLKTTTLATMGRHITSIHEDVYVEIPDASVDTNPQVVALLASNKLRDRFRTHIGAFYSEYEKNITFYNTLASYTFFDKVEFLPNNQIRLTANQKNARYLENGVFSPMKFQAFVKDLIEPNQEYRSSFISLKAPVDRANGWQTYPEASVEPTYNYFEHAYERGGRNEYVEQALPNVNIMAAELERKETTATSLDHLLSLTDNAYLDERRICMEQVRNGTYFTKFPKRYDDAAQRKFLDTVAKKQRTFVFAGADQDALKRRESTKESVPMYVAVDMDTSASLFSRLLEETKFDDVLLQYFLSDAHWTTQRRFVLDTDSSSEKAVLKDVRVFDLGAWINEYASDTYGSGNAPKNLVPNDEVVYYGEYENRRKDLMLQRYSLERVINWAVFVGSYEESINKHARSVSDMFANSKPTYTETLAYRVDKKDFQNGKVLQSFYFMNTAKQEVLRYIDSQVKYGTLYQYDIVALQLAISERYQYGAVQEGTDAQASFPCVVSPVVEVVELVVYTGLAKVGDVPSVGPSVRLIQTVGSNDSVRFLIEPAFDSYRAEPISILPSDASVWFRTLQQQKSKDGKVQFGTDDRPVRYQIFRLEKEPTEWKDFAAGVVREVDAKYSLFDDSIESGKTYFYCFRSIDAHEHISMPSSMFTVKIVDDGGVVYTVANTHEFAVKTRDKKEKNFKSKISINPAYLQSVVETDDFGVYKKTGIDDASVWSRPIRMRIRSKNTGRYVDVYLKFTLDDKLVIGQTLKSGV